jgi:hypothetical protein
MTQPKFDPNLICPFCGTNAVQHNGKRYISPEHVPPQSVFVDKNDKHGLITVPSCSSCNGGTSEQDERFKFQLSIQLGVDTPQKKAFWDSCRESLHHKSSWRNNVIANTSPLLMPYGQGYGHPVALDVHPMQTVIIKIIRGLHWKVTGEVLPPTVETSINILQQGYSLDGELLAMFNKFGKSIQKCGD